MKNKKKADVEEILTDERLENGMKHQPDRYLETRDSNGKLIEVLDKDSGRLWKRLSDGSWMWVS